MTRLANWYPNEIFRLLLNLGSENGKLAYSEVAYMLLREALAPYGFDCVHSNVAFPKNAVGTDRNKPYCKDCYARLERIETIGSLRGKTLSQRQPEYRAKETFVDKKRKENSKKAEAANEAKIRAEVDAKIKAFVDAAATKKKEEDTFTPGTE